MQNTCESHFHSNIINSSTAIFYNFVGNFVPPEWKSLVGDNDKKLSKTARQLLSLIVFRLQIYHNNSIDELQESYSFFEQSLGVCQERVRQCLVELQKSGFIRFEKVATIKYGIKCRYTICVKLIKEFKPCSQKFTEKNEKNLELGQKKIGVSPKEVLGQPQKSLGTYIDNKENRYNKSRSSESGGGDEKNLDAGIDENFQQQEEEKPAQPKLETENLKSAAPDSRLEDVRTYRDDSVDGASSLGSIVANIVDKAIARTESARNHSARHKNWFKRKKLVDFYPLIQEDADWLQANSNREFNLSFINKLLLKLAEQYPEHHFGHKKVVLTYMAKALANELRETNIANNEDFQFSDKNKFKEQYLEKIENSKDVSQEGKLKHKIAGVFESDMAYMILSSCIFVGMEGNQYQIKLLKNISLSEHIKTKILHQVKAVYGKKIEQLQIIPFSGSSSMKQESTTPQKQQGFPLESFAPDSIWYKVRTQLIKKYGTAIDYPADGSNLHLQVEKL
ncbi:MAG: hypothetical protein LN588_02825 [Rickettsia endosymbiont of Bryobia graminum]|nr:hypothetical protein [Rickettsia endosymbiont of Bryobia graminum]